MHQHIHRIQSPNLPPKEPLLSQLVDCYVQIWREPPWNETWDPEVVRQDILDQAARSFATFCIESRNRALVTGFTWGYKVTPAELRQIASTDEVLDLGVIEPIAYVDELGVHPSWRRRKIGGTLTLELLHSFQKLEFRTVIVRTHIEAEPAVNLYRKVGFQPTGILDRKYPNREYYLKVLPRQVTRWEPGIWGH